jgi:hypothetical protein
MYDGKYSYIVDFTHTMNSVSIPSSQFTLFK